MRDTIAALTLVASMIVAFVAVIWLWVGLIGPAPFFTLLAGAVCAGLAASKALKHHED
jgi:O-antigen/teichoic acid export membrane protein